MLVQAILGALDRRYHGGWLNIPTVGKPVLKKILNYVMAFICCFFSGISFFPSLLITALLGTALLAPYFPHAIGTWMINGKDNPGREHTILGDFISLWKCYMPFVIGVAAILALSNPVKGICYAVLGTLIPVAYYAAKKVWEKFNLPVPTGDTDKFITDHTSIGELALGAILYGGLGL